MIKGVLRYGVATLLAVLSAGGTAAERASVNIEEHRESVAPLIEHGGLVKTTKPTPTPTPTPTRTPAPTTATTATQGTLVRAVFAKQIVKREPVDEVTTLSSDMQGVYFFTELEDMAGHTVKHVWEYDGRRVGYTEFKVTAAHWRAWSYRKTPPGTSSTWKVKVLNTAGEVIGEKLLAPKAAP
ncbi:MAG: DUF2914 domain-containing protein [Gammaproteobacteria bacterium]|nr:DUF2914 domain-containing protein [Gammaproteobacteria bacterium]